jgi:hypothetical protein
MNTAAALAPPPPRGKDFGTTLDRRLGGPEIRSGRCGENINSAVPEIEHRPSSPSHFTRGKVLGRGDIVEILSL